MFSCEFCEIFKNTFLPEHLQTTASVDTNHSFKTQQRSHISREITWKFNKLLERNQWKSFF